MQLLSKQQGAVLAFSLVMLLLLTLLGVSMIQQNRQQLIMSGNTRQQNQVFADAETALFFAAEKYIRDKRYMTAAAFICKKDRTASPFSDPAVTDLNNSTVDVTTDVQNNISLNTMSNLKYEITERYCFTGAGSVLRCNSLNDEDYLGCEQWINDLCSAEIYTMVTTATDTSGTKRQIESKYAVNCEGGYL